MPTTETTKSGITTTATGDRHIPSSVRADGTVRKEIKVRPGYRPPEDVEVYKNRTAEAFKNRGRGGVPGAEWVDTKAKPLSKPTKPKSATKGTQSVKKQEAEAPAVPAEPVDPEAEKEKEAKKLAKKLRQARDLQQKKEEGGALLPEQFEKVIRINELIRQLDKLGFDNEGNRKT